MAFKFESQDFKQQLELVKAMINQHLKDNPENQIRELALIHAKISDVFLEQSEYLDQYTEFSRSKLHYNKYIQNQINDNENNIKFVRVLNTSCGLFYVYLKELTFRSPQQVNEITLRIPNYIDFIEDFNSLDHDFNFYKKYGRDKLHIEILRDLFQSEKFVGLMDAESKLDQIRSDITSWEKSLDLKKKDVFALGEKLENYKTTYDFVLLNKGFKELYEQKKLELKERRNGYSSFGAMLFFTPLCSIALFIFLYFSLGEEALKFIIYLALPITTFMIIVFYFVRVGLQHVRSVQSQMMQLELRMALCQFIHNYADDSEKLHAKNKVGFEKFENIIFSPLVSSDDKIPTTFDGMEQLAKLVSEFRK